MIYLLLNNIDDIKLGGLQVDKVYVGNVEVWNKQIYYGGIPCYIDNARYESSVGNLYNYVSNNEYFLAFCDIGENNKPLTFGYTNNNGGYTMFCWKDLPTNGQDRSDYWSVMQNRRVIMAGRYCVFPVKKESAKYFYAYDDNGNYYLKGNEVQ